MINQYYVNELESKVEQLECDYGIIKEQQKIYRQKIDQVKADNHKLSEKETQWATEQRLLLADIQQIKQEMKDRENKWKEKQKQWATDKQLAIEQKEKEKERLNDEWRQKMEEMRQIHDGLKYELMLKEEQDNEKEEQCMKKQRVMDNMSQQMMDYQDQIEKQKQRNKELDKQKQIMEQQLNKQSKMIIKLEEQLLEMDGVIQNLNQKYQKSKQTSMDVDDDKVKQQLDYKGQLEHVKQKQKVDKVETRKIAKQLENECKMVKIERERERESWEQLVIQVEESIELKQEIDISCKLDIQQKLVDEINRLIRRVNKENKYVDKNSQQSMNRQCQKLKEMLARNDMQRQEWIRLYENNDKQRDGNDRVMIEKEYRKQLNNQQQLIERQNEVIIKQSTIIEQFQQSEDEYQRIRREKQKMVDREEQLEIDNRKFRQIEQQMESMEQQIVRNRECRRILGVFYSYYIQMERIIQLEYGEDYRRRKKRVKKIGLVIIFVNVVSRQIKQNGSKGRSYNMMNNFRYFIMEQVNRHARIIQQ